MAKMSRYQENAAYLNDPRVVAFLTAVNAAEGAPFANQGLNYKGFTSMADHPRESVRGPFNQTDGKKSTSNPAGLYQFMPRTWDGLRRTMPELTDFTARNQHIAAVELLRQRGALPLVLKNDLDGAIKKAAPEWAGLPGGPYPQPSKSIEFVRAAYNAGLARSQKAGAPVLPTGYGKATDGNTILASLGGAPVAKANADRVKGSAGHTPVAPMPETPAGAASATIDGDPLPQLNTDYNAMTDPLVAAESAKTDSANASALDAAIQSLSAGGGLKGATAALTAAKEQPDTGYAQALQRIQDLNSGIPSAPVDTSYTDSRTDPTLALEQMQQQRDLQDGINTAQNAALTAMFKEDTYEAPAFDVPSAVDRYLEKQLPVG